MQLEDKSAMICFVNFILALTLAILIRMIIALMKKILKRESKQVSQLKQDWPNTFKYIIGKYSNIKWFCQFFILKFIAELLIDFSYFYYYNIILSILKYH